MAVLRSVVRGVGGYLPKRVLTNDDLAKIVDTSDAWISERTGIRARRIAADGELTSDLGIAASRQALQRSGIAPGDVDLLVCATSTPDRTFPATAVRVSFTTDECSGSFTIGVLTGGGEPGCCQ